MRYERILNIIFYKSATKWNAKNISRKILQMRWKRVELKLQAFLYIGPAQPIARGQHVARDKVLHCLEKNFIPGNPV